MGIYVVVGDEGSESLGSTEYGVHSPGQGLTTGWRLWHPRRSIMSERPGRSQLDTRQERLVRLDLQLPTE